MTHELPPGYCAGATQKSGARKAAKRVEAARAWRGSAPAFLAPRIHTHEVNEYVHDDGHDGVVRDVEVGNLTEVALDDHKVRVEELGGLADVVDCAEAGRKRRAGAVGHNRCATCRRVCARAHTHPRACTRARRHQGPSGAAASSTTSRCARIRIKWCQTCSKGEEAGARASAGQLAAQCSQGIRRAPAGHRAGGTSRRPALRASAAARRPSCGTHMIADISVI